MRKFFWIYGLLSLVVIAVKLLSLDYLENFLKPLLMPSLVLYYYLSNKKLQSYDYKIIFALIFSTLGDLLLMPFFNQFIPGLIAFLIAHLFYIFAFKSENQKLVHLADWKKRFFIISFFIYALLLYFIYQNVESTVLLIAVTTYATILLVLLMAAVIRNPLNKNSSQLIVYGAFLFMLSDGMIAINKFVIEIPYEAFFIMATYTLAQALLVEGSRIRNQ